MKHPRTLAMFRRGISPAIHVPLLELLMFGKATDDGDVLFPAQAILKFWGSRPGLTASLVPEQQSGVPLGQTRRRRTDWMMLVLVLVLVLMPFSFLGTHPSDPFGYNGKHIVYDDEFQ